jgi:hypothetical protein
MIDTRIQKHSLLPGDIGRKEAAETGMALALICLIAALWTDNQAWTKAGLGILLLDMVWARAFTWPARLWLGLSHLMGTVMSKVVLSLVFFLVVTPIGLVRRVAGKDPMRIKAWKQGTGSVFVDRGEVCTPEEIEHPF